MTRAEHLEWCKQRARKYLVVGDVMNGVTSMLSDLRKHPETEELSKAGYAMIGMHMMANKDLEGAKRFVEGFR